MRTEEVGRARESTSISVIPPIPRLIDNELLLQAKKRDVWSVPNPSGAEAIFQIASSCFGSLSVHCSCHTETRYANASYPKTEILKMLKISDTFWKTRQLT